MKLGFVVVAAAGLLLSQPGHAAEIKLLASGATHETCNDLIPLFEKASGHKVQVTFAGTVNIKKRMAAGEVFDVVFMARPEIDAFIQQGKMLPGSRVDLMKSGVGAAVKAGAPRPDISSPESLKKALLAAKSIGYSSGPSGMYMVKLFERMGIAEQVKPKLIQTVSPTRVGVLVARGDAGIGFQQVSELIHESGIDFLGPLPAGVQEITVFSAALLNGVTQPDAAKALVKFFTGPEAATVIKKHGMEPG